MKIVLKNLRTALTAALTTIAMSGFAANTTVNVGPSGARIFSPATVNINVGDSVIWVWQSTFHSTTSGTNNVHADDNGSPCGLWDSTLITSTPHTFTNTFTVSGNYSYYCSQHWNSGMTGAVFVANSLTPLISIISPASNTVFAAPANVTIQATASESGGSIANVQFLVGSAVFTNETTAPFSATTNNLAAGAYTLSAIATDGGGATATSAVPISVVTPVAVTLSNLVVVSRTNFQFSYLVNTGLSYVVQRSVNLSSANWISLVTNVAASNPAVFLDTHATNNPAFYRIGRMPNP